MKFGTVEDLNEIIKMQKKSKNSNYLQSYNRLKNAILARSSLHDLKNFLNL